MNLLTWLIILLGVSVSVYWMAAASAPQPVRVRRAAARGRRVADGSARPGQGRNS